MRLRRRGIRALALAGSGVGSFRTGKQTLDYKLRDRAAGNDKGAFRPPTHPKGRDDWGTRRIHRLSVVSWRCSVGGNQGKQVPPLRVRPPATDAGGKERGRSGRDDSIMEIRSSRRHGRDGSPHSHRMAVVGPACRSVICTMPVGPGPGASFGHKAFSESADDVTPNCAHHQRENLSCSSAFCSQHICHSSGSPKIVE